MALNAYCACTETDVSARDTRLTRAFNVSGHVVGCGDERLLVRYNTKLRSRYFFFFFNTDSHTSKTKSQTF